MNQDEQEIQVSTAGRVPNMKLYRRDRMEKGKSKKRKKVDLEKDLP